MEEEIKILTEETGCSEELARSILIETSGNLNLAFKRIATESNHFLIVKGKFALPNIYNSGIFIIILNTSKKKIHRLAVTLLNNPSLFEEDININWYDIERKVYVERLSEASRRDVSNQIEQELISSIKQSKKFYTIFEEEKNLLEELKEFLSKVFIRATFQDSIFMDIIVERISLKELRRIDESEEVMESGKENVVSVNLELSLPEERISPYPKISIEKLKVGESILVNITDSRDIGIYLSRLLGGKIGSKYLPIPALVEEKIKRFDGYFLRLSFTPQISGELFVKTKGKVFVYSKLYSKKGLYLFIFLLLLVIGIVLIFLW